ncbi:MAG: c-type cytochrome [Terriglobia bacterium]
MRTSRMQMVWLLALLAALPALSQEAGRNIYMQRCFWCHGEEGRGDGPSAVGMFPRPRDLVQADYKIRSTPHGQLPTEEDIFQVISRGLPGTPMPGWETVLTKEERWELVSYLKLLSPRFQSEKPEPLTLPGGTGSAERGKETYRTARCFMCHGDAGRADGGITTTLNFEWGLPHWARDFTRGWTFKGGSEPRDIYLRITGGLTGTPMGPYQDLLSEQERWDLAHYIASLDQEPGETSDDFVVIAVPIEGEIPGAPEAPEWQGARPIVVPLGGTGVRRLPWRIPTATSVTVRALWNLQRIGFLLEWNDPTGPESSAPDSALLQFAAQNGSKPYFLFGNTDDSVKVWRWHTGNRAEEWTAAGERKIQSHPPTFQAYSNWKDGRWQVVLRGPLAGAPTFEMGGFVPVLFSISDGGNAEFGIAPAISTWLYTTLQRPRSLRPWLSASVSFLGVVILQLWVLSRLRT